MLSSALGLEAVSSSIPAPVCCNCIRFCPSQESEVRISFSVSAADRIEASGMLLPQAAYLLAWGIGAVFSCHGLTKSWCRCGQRWRQVARTSGNLTLGVGLQCFGGWLSRPSDCTPLCCIHGLTVLESSLFYFVVTFSHHVSMLP